MSNGSIPAVGAHAFGGIVVGRVEPPNADGWLLIAAPKSIDTDGWKWQTSTDDAPDQTRNPYDGLRATEAMVGSAKRFPAAEWCAGLDSPRDGGSDWYLPSRHELWLMTLALMGTDDQLENDWYWSATESSASDAWHQTVGGSYAGYQYYNYKTTTNFRVRPVRRVALSTFTFSATQVQLNVAGCEPGADFTVHVKTGEPQVSRDEAGSLLRQLCGLASLAWTKGVSGVFEADRVNEACERALGAIYAQERC